MQVGDFNSICSETYTGWWFTDDRKGDWGCAIGTQTASKYELEGKVEITSDRAVLSAEVNKAADAKEGVRFSSQRQSVLSPLLNFLQLKGFLRNKRHGDSRADVEKAKTMVTVQELDEGDHKLFVPNMNFIQLVNENAESTWSARDHAFLRTLTVRQVKERLGKRKHYISGERMNKGHLIECGNPDLSKYPEELDWSTVQGGIYQ
jgi:hypothetical protein